MRLIYAEVFQCDACGETAHVEQPTTAAIAESPRPSGWIVSEVLVLRRDRGAPATVDVCSSCLALPFGQVVRKLRPA